MQYYLFIGGPYHNTTQQVEGGRLIWNLPEPRKYPIPCRQYSPPIEHKITIHTYRRFGLNIRKKFIGYIFAKADLTDEQVIDLFLELKRT